MPTDDEVEAAAKDVKPAWEELVREVGPHSITVRHYQRLAVVSPTAAERVRSLNAEQRGDG